MINYSVEEIATLLEGELVGNCNLKICNIKPIETATTGDLTFYYNDKYFEYFDKSNCTCIIISETNDKVPNENQAFIKVKNPYGKFVQLLKIIESQKVTKISDIHRTAIIGNYSLVGLNVRVSANCVIGDNCIIEDGVQIMPGVVIYDNVKIGRNTIIHSNVTLCQDIIIGSDCIIYAGAVIGSDGFGYIENKIDGSYDKVPQLGNVVIENNVEIGANTTIDRALVGSTTIRKGTKIDNLVHIAHNCEIGENTGIAAQAGISGSVTTGKKGRFGGQVGIAGHLEIADEVTILAQSGVSKSIPKSGVYFGSPIKEHIKAFKIEAVIRQLPELNSEIGKIKSDLRKIIEKIGD